MSQGSGVIAVAYDAPEAASSWLEGEHYSQLLAVPGVTRVRRFECVSSPVDRRYLTLIEAEDVAQLLAWRQGGDGLESKRAADARGVKRRDSRTWLLIFDSAKPDTDT